MSDLVFPVMPLIERAADSSPVYATKTLRTPSGKRVAASWRSSSLDSIAVKITLREWVTAPSGAWGSISERAMVRYFFTTHRGSWDSFKLDNSTGVYLPGGDSQPRVIFSKDTLSFHQEVPGLFSVAIQWEVVAT